MHTSIEAYNLLSARASFGGGELRIRNLGRKNKSQETKKRERQKDPCFVPEALAIDALNDVAILFFFGLLLFSFFLVSSVQNIQFQIALKIADLWSVGAPLHKRSEVIFPMNSSTFLILQYAPQHLSFLFSSIIWDNVGWTRSLFQSSLVLNGLAYVKQKAHRRHSRKPITIFLFKIFSSEKNLTKTLCTVILVYFLRTSLM